jgi:hypothetical protein
VTIMPIIIAEVAIRMVKLIIVSVMVSPPTVQASAGTPRLVERQLGALCQ